MPLFLMQIRLSEIENVQSLVLKENNTFVFDISNGSGEVKQSQEVSTLDEIEIEGSRGKANYCMRWTKGAPQAYIKIETIKKCNGSYLSSSLGEWVTVVGFEARGLEMDTVRPSNYFDVISSEGKRFCLAEADNEEDWADYDEDRDQSVSYMGLSYRLIKA